jgi:hypothetical protein
MTYEAYSFCSICGGGAQLVETELQQWACSPEHARAAAQSTAKTCLVLIGHCPYDGGVPVPDGGALDAAPVVEPAPNAVTDAATD